MVNEARWTPLKNASFQESVCWFLLPSMIYRSSNGWLNGLPSAACARRQVALQS